MVQAWTETSADLNTARYKGEGAGTYTGALIFGSNPSWHSGSITNIVESWNGSAGSEVADLASNVRSGSSTGSSTTLFMLVDIMDLLGNTEEWAFSGLHPPTTPSAGYVDAIVGDFYYNSTTGQFKTINTGGGPIGTWASGGNINTGRRLYEGGAGTQTAAIVFSGFYSPGSNYLAITESYDGSSWTEVNDLNEGRNGTGGAGTSTAAFCTGGYDGSARVVSNETWDGTNWTEVNDINTARAVQGSSGTLPTGLIFGGETPSADSALTESWNGTNGHLGRNLNQARSQIYMDRTWKLQEHNTAVFINNRS